jgi:hypothetical protein
MLMKKKVLKEGTLDGRPTKYDYASMHELVLEYIKECVDEVTEFHKTRGDKSDSYDRIIQVKLPSIEGLCIKLKISKDTLYQWEKEHKEFSDDIEEVRKIQAERLINNGLNGSYNPTIAKVLLTKHGYREGIEQTGADGKDLFKPSNEEKGNIDKVFGNL